MQYTMLGRTGLVVSRLALGTMTFGAAYGAIAKVDQAGANALVARALEAGVTLFDTADQYSGGQAEDLLAQPVFTSVIVGASTAEQLSDNLAAGTLTLTADEIAMLNALTASPSLYPNWMQTLFPDTVLQQALGA
jgi:aryl-alcohol dehydrogenase-like predicted oxidoreductase